MEEEEIEKSLKTTKRYNSKIATRKLTCWSIWQIFSRDYRNREMKAKALEKNSAVLNISAVLIKSKLTSLREVNKVRKTKCGQAFDDFCTGEKQVNLEVI